MKRVARLALALALVPAAAPAAAQVTTAVVHQVARAEHGDTTSLTFHVRGPTTALLSEPFVLPDRTRLYLDIDGATTAPDSAALVRLAGDNIVALAPRMRTGGTAVAIDVRVLAGYTIAQDDSTITVRIAKTHAPAVAAAPAAPVASQSPAPAKRWTLESLRTLPQPDAGATAIAIAAGLALLVAPGMIRRARPRRRPAPGPAAAPVVPPAPASPAVSISPDGRIWAARALDAAGASITEIARRTGLAREAVQFLRATRTPAESAASGRNFRAEGAGPADPSPRPRVKAVV